MVTRGRRDHSADCHGGPQQGYPWAFLSAKRRRCPQHDPSLRGRNCSNVLLSNVQKKVPPGCHALQSEMVGNQFKIAIGKKAGKYNVLWHLENMGQNLNEEQLQEMVDKIKAEAINKRQPY